MSYPNIEYFSKMLKNTKSLRQAELRMTTDQAVLLLGPGKSFIMGSTVDSIGIEADHTATAALADLESIKAINNAGSDTTQLEVFIAS